MIAVHPDIKGVSSGAVLSAYQRIRIEFVCAKLGLTSIGYLWQREQSDLLREMTQQSGVKAIFVKVAVPGLGSQHIGTDIGSHVDYLLAMEKSQEMNTCGEGGEYESFTLDCPLFRHRIVIDRFEVLTEGKEMCFGRVPNSNGTVSYLDLKDFHLERKNDDIIESEKKYLTPLRVVDVNQVENSVKIDVAVTGEDDKLWAQQYVSDEISFVQSLPKKQDINSQTASIPELFTTTDQTSFFYLPAKRVLLDSGNLSDTVFDLIRSIKENKYNAKCAHINLFVPSMGDFGTINAGYMKNFSTQPPSRACTQSTLFSAWSLQCNLERDNSLLLPHASADCQLIVPRTAELDVLHVQGLSHWAPANIGPYAQAVGYQGFYSYAGQIGLLPHDLSLPSQPSLQFHQMVRNISNVLKQTNTDIASSIFGGSFFIAKECLDMLSFEQSLAEIQQYYVPEAIKTLEDQYNPWSTSTVSKHNAAIRNAQKLCYTVRCAMMRHKKAIPLVQTSTAENTESETEIELGEVSSADEYDDFDEAEEEENADDSDSEESLVSLCDAKAQSRCVKLELSNESSPMVTIKTEELSLYAPISYSIAPCLPRSAFYEFQTSALPLSRKSLNDRAIFSMYPVYEDDTKTTILAVLIISGVLKHSNDYLSLNMSVLMSKHTPLSQKTLDKIALQVSTQISDLQSSLVGSNIEILWSKITYQQTLDATSLQQSFRNCDTKLNTLANTSFIPSCSMIFSTGETLNSYRIIKSIFSNWENLGNELDKEQLFIISTIDQWWCDSVLSSLYQLNSATFCAVKVLDEDDD